MHTVSYAGVQQPALGLRCEYLAASRQGLKRGLLHFDVQQAQRVEAPMPVGGYARVEAIWPPAICEEHYGYRLQQAGRSDLALIADTLHHSMDKVLLEERHPEPMHRSNGSSLLSELLASLPTSHSCCLRQ